MVDAGKNRNQSAKDAIVRAMIELMASSSSEDIRVKELLAKAEVARSVFYYHFDSVDSVIEYMIDFFVEGLCRAVSDMIPRSQISLRNFSEAYESNPQTLEMFSFTYANRDLYLALANDAFASPVFRRRLKDRLIDAYEDCDYFFSDKTGRRCMLAPREREYYIESIVSRHMGVISCWSKRGFAERPEELLGLTVALDQAVHAPDVEKKKRYKDYGQIQFVSWRDLATGGGSLLDS